MITGFILAGLLLLMLTWWAISYVGKSMTSLIKLDFINRGDK